MAPAQAAPGDLTTLSTDTFQDATTVSPNWMKPSGSNVACLTASGNTSQLPIPGCQTTALDTPGSGALRLTPALNTQVGTVYSTVSLPTAQGLSIKFNTYQYGNASRADGIAFILAATNPANPSAPATTGPSGGALGYASGPALTPPANGVAYGYLGFGLDVFGNFVNRTAVGGSNCSGDQAASTAVRDSIAVRGPGNGLNGYCLLARTTVGNQGLDRPSSSARPAPVPVEIALNPSATAATTEGGLNVPANSWVMRVGGYNSTHTLSGALPSMAGIAPASWLDGAGRPYQLTFGWAGSTGGSTEVHEINTLAAETVNGKLPAYALAIGDNQNGQFLTGGTSCVVTSPAAGSYAVTATYHPAPTSPYAGQTASTSFTVAKAAAPFTAQAVPATTDYATTATVTATGLPAGATGTVTFTDAGGTVLCTATLPAVSCTTPDALPVGTHPITATYSGDANHNGSTASTSLTVTEATPTLTAAISDPSISYGGTTTLSYAGLTLTGPTAATGTVTFTDAGGAVLCTATLPAGSCATSASLPVGDYQITATYSGDDNHASATAAPVSLEVTRAATALTASAASGDITYGDSDTLSYAGLTLTGPTAATGTVTFTDAGGTVLCTATLPATSCTTSASLPAGDYTVTAQYSGDANHEGGSAAPFTLRVGTQGTTGMTAAATPSSTPYGTPGTLSHAGLPLAGATAATGTVTFTGPGGDVLCTTTLPATSCQPPADLPAGDYPVTATYSGDNNHEGTTASTSFEVTRATTAITAAAGSPSVVHGTGNTLSHSGLTLSGPTAATGTVTFTDADGEVLCTATLPETSCTTSTSLPAGSYAVTASYSGDDNHQGSSAATSFEVTRAATAVALVAGPGSHNVATPLTATGLPDGATGTVTFTDSDGTVLCTATLPATSCQAPAGLTAGTHTVTVSYSGDANHVPSTGTLAIEIARGRFPITAVPSVSSATAGQPVTITVSGVPADATGTLTITSAGTPVCTITLPGNSCVLPTTLAVGDHQFAVSYSGDSEYEPTATTTGVAVVPVPRVPEAVTADPDDRTATVPVPSGPGITVTVVEGPAHGSAQLIDGRLVYTANAGFSGTDTVTYLVTYPDGSTRLVTVTITMPATDSDGPELPVTGAMTGPLLAIMAALLLGGITLLAASRSRRRA